MPDNTCQRFACNFDGCSRSFVQRSHLKRHLENHANETKFKCEYCERGFKRSDVLQTHRKKVHAGGELVDPKAVKAKPFECLACGKKYKFASSLDNHSRKMHRSELEGEDTALQISPESSVDATTPEDNTYPSPLQAEPVYANSEPRYNILNFSPSQNSDPEDFRGIATSMFQDNDLSWLFIPSAASSIQGNFAQTDEYRKGFAPFPAEFIDNNLGASRSLEEMDFGISIATESLARGAVDWFEISKELRANFKVNPKYVTALDLSTFLSAESVQRNFELYFASFHDHFPILHKPSFMANPERVPPLLMVSILTLGALRDSEKNYKVAVAIHEGLTGQVFSHSNDLIPCKLWIIQTLALIQAFTKMGSTRLQHNLSTSFHSSIITFLKRDGSCTNMRSHKRVAHSNREQWELWIEQESIKRVVFLILIMDAQHSVLFGHVSFLSVSEIRLEMPCQDALWELGDEISWKKSIDSGSSHKTPMFLDMLKSLMDCKSIPVTLSSFSKLVVLHGLLNVIWSVLREEKESFVIINQDIAQKAEVQSRRKAILARAIERWHDSLPSRKHSKAIEACESLHHIAYMTLFTSNTSILEILAFCSPSLTGFPVSKADRSKAFGSLERWYESEESTKCVKHAIELIQHITLSNNVSPSGTYDAAEDPIVFRPWCLYIATLIVWSYCFLANGKQLSASTDDTNHSATAEQFLVDLLGPLRRRAQNYKELEPLPNLNNCRSLLVAVRDNLEGSRWEMLNDAYHSLGRLLNVVGQNSPIANA